MVRRSITIVVAVHLLLASIFSESVFLQEPSEYDRIFKKDGTMIPGVVLRITEEEVEIDPLGEISFLSVDRNDIQVIIYRDGKILVLNRSEDRYTVPLKVEQPRRDNTALYAVAFAGLLLVAVLAVGLGHGHLHHSWH
ncbi:MAG: hypothetical protein ACE5OR_12550 [bacterium]